MMMKTLRLPRCALVLAAAWTLSGAAASAQPLVAEAAVGRPFGVAHIEIDLPQAVQPEPLGPEGLKVIETTGRVFYPVVHAPDAGKIIRELLDQTQRPIAQIIGGFFNRPPRAQVYFLFRGDAPLEVVLNTQPPTPVVIAPVAEPVHFDRIFRGWSRAYMSPPPALVSHAHYPPIVQSYLQATLSRRLGLVPPPPRRKYSWQESFERELGLTLSTEPIRVAMQQERILGQAPLSGTAALPLPPALDIPPMVVPPPPAEVTIEPIARRVPADCYYLRFGSYTNFLWFQDTMARWGGDLRNLVEQRGLDYGVNARVQWQLSLKESLLSRLFGEAAIADAALVGMDLFMPEGGSTGILFYARAPLLLANNIAAQRDEAVKANPGAKLEKTTIGGKEVSFLWTADNSLRSFYAASGDYHFVANSRALMERFLATADGKSGLAATAEFRHARSVLPTSRNDAVFIYLPDGLFRNLASPHYRIETGRRLQALADIELVQLAQLNAATEGQPGETIEELQRGGFLPPDFGPRPDGSRTVVEAERVYDSVRGTRGLFVPVPDVAVTAVTPSEAEAYARFAENFATRLGRIDPILAGLRHAPVDGGGRERVTVDVLMSPLNRQRYDFFMRTFGPPQPSRLAAVPGDMAAIDLVLARQRLFGALGDFTPVPQLGEMVVESHPSILPTGRLRDLLYGYLGSVGPDPGYLALLERGRWSPPDAAGFSRSRLDVWRREFEPFTLYSFHPEILANVAPQLRFEPVDQPAQAWVRIADPSQARLVPLLNSLVYGRSRQTTLGNLRLMEAMSTQLHVPPEDGLAAAELLLGAKLVCPLGGQYSYRQGPDGIGAWSSTAMAEGGRDGIFHIPPTTYVAQPLTWFRGLNAQAALVEGKMTIHAEVDMLSAPPKLK